MPPSLAALLYILVSALVLWLTPAEDRSAMATGVAVAGFCLLAWVATRETEGHADGCNARSASVAMGGRRG